MAPLVVTSCIVTCSNEHQSRKQFQTNAHHFTLCGSYLSKLLTEDIAHVHHFYSAIMDSYWKCNLFGVRQSRGSGLTHTCAIYNTIAIFTDLHWICWIQLGMWNWWLLILVQSLVGCRHESFCSGPRTVHTVQANPLPLHWRLSKLLSSSKEQCALA